MHQNITAELKSGVDTSTGKGLSEMEKMDLELELSILGSSGVGGVGKQQAQMVASDPGERMVVCANMSLVLNASYEVLADPSHHFWHSDNMHVHVCSLRELTLVKILCGFVTCRPQHQHHSMLQQLRWCKC